MTSLQLHVNDLPGRDEVLRLYDAVGWSAYTKDPERLMRGLHHSLRVVTARADRRLIGLARVVGDGETIVYLQDILVLPALQGTGIGRRLFEAAFSPYAGVRQHVLITDQEPRQRAFYEAMGFKEIGDAGGRAFVRYQH
ncbi:GNAT family N-acetyltransferase [uncultured Tessaracoccus sp.]|uniref:GNAT family N-acetyltransferase n=1 Tax=uncultured Tessaracoccus sp. TaxID=905023 RepID=UPI0026286CEA|nr:GNAT family N-acetyltransferase [uncultured Tessaracoccus sp.]